MALTDIYTTPSVAAALSTGGAATSVFGTAIDLTNRRDIGDGEDMYMDINITTTVTSAGSATLGFEFVTADDSSLTTNVTVILSTPVVAKASLVAGYRYPVIEIPMGVFYRRYIGFRQVIGTAALTAGKATCALVRKPANWRAYDDGIN